MSLQLVNKLDLRGTSPFFGMEMCRFVPDFLTIVSHACFQKGHRDTVLGLVGNEPLGLLNKCWRSFLAANVRKTSCAAHIRCSFFDSDLAL